MQRSPARIFTTIRKGKIMKINKKLSEKFKKCAYIGMSVFVTGHAFAADKLATVMSGDIKDMLGSSGTFWKIFILVDIILSAAMAIKAKNPMVFAGVFFIALLPGFLINTFVFAP
jgi:hypothetical protein